MVLESRFPTTHGGGAESQVRTLGVHLRRLGHRVIVLTPRLPDGPQATVGRHFGLAVVRLVYPTVSVLGAMVMLIRLAAFLIGRRRHYDVIHVHIAHHMGALCCLLGPWLGKRVIVKVSGWWELELGV